MKRSALFASLALTAGLAVPAFAQEIGGMTIPEEDWGLVEQRCAELEGEPISEVFEDEPTAAAEANAPEGIDLSTLTRTDCEEAGILEPTGEAPDVTNGEEPADDTGEPPAEDGDETADDANDDGV
ncbi:hypothetical protein [Pelagibacterium sp. H642]|uniref:hypothetical protein n=1 Tax=Pelagibacterium sp. H642 TaxID=1881069 RepID=UPI002814EFDC|nr:hypothetical protein [Pelagibacterium sp. H642]WMT89973.1 hypothetical protein NO934_14405 [Pelagibacterium sp. H642]